MNNENEKSGKTDNPNERLRSEDRATSSGGVPAESEDPKNGTKKEIITNNDEFGDDLAPQKEALHEPTADNGTDDNAKEPENVEVEARQDDEQNQLDDEETVL